MNRQDARGKIEKLVTFFGDNIYEFKSPNFNETQARQQLKDIWAASASQSSARSPRLIRR